MGNPRKPFLLLALVLIVIVVLIEIGSGLAISQPPEEISTSQLPESPPSIRQTFADNQGEVADLARSDRSPGLAIPYLALLDSIVLFTVGLKVLKLTQSRLQGCTSCLFSLLLTLAVSILIIIALSLVILMISLLLAVPFGTIAYFALYGSFNRTGASAVLILVMLFKLFFSSSLVAAQPAFLKDSGLVLLVLTSLLGNIIISFLYGLVPRFLVSITDGVGAIIVAILAIIWLVILGIGSLVSVVSAFKPT